MNHLMLSDRELAAVVRALDQPHHTMANHWREALQRKVRAARRRRPDAIPRVLGGLVAIHDRDGAPVHVAYGADRFTLLKGWTAYSGWFVPDPDATPPLHRPAGEKGVP